MERSGDEGKGRLVLATVKGDVHDIGKNLVDIILSNNGYQVINLGIKQSIQAILDAAADADADAIGMSGLLVKSTVIMKDNLLEMNQRGLAERWPVLLGGAALTRAYVEQDLGELFDGEVRYARDAFEGLALMEAVMAVKRGEPDAVLPQRRTRRVRTSRAASSGEDRGSEPPVTRSDVRADNVIPTPPFWGDRVIKGIPLAEYSAYLDERALLRGQWGLKPTAGDRESYDELLEREGRVRLRSWLDRVATEGLLEPAVAYGYFPAWSQGERVVIGDAAIFSDQGRRVPVAHFDFPRQQRGRFLCLADYVRAESALTDGSADVLALSVVTMGSSVSNATKELFEADKYRDYLELHGLSVQLAEALAEYWHARVRSELGIAGDDARDVAGVLKQHYQGERYSFGYPACPDLEQQAVLFKLLDPNRIGVQLSEEFQLHPEQSTSALIFHHPEATYFNAR